MQDICMNGLSSKEVNLYGTYRDPLKYRYNGWKKAAKRRGINWNLTLDIVRKKLNKQNYRCFYTTAQLKFEPHSKFLVSLDRLDSSKGYTKNNVVFCAADVNRMKTDLDVNEFYKLCSYVTANSLLKGLIK